MMRSFVSLSFALVLTLALPDILAAQQSRPPGPPDSARVEQTISEMRVKVKLTDAQVPKVRAILMESRAAMQRDLAKGQIDRQAAREQMLVTDDKIKSVLTPEQLPLYDQYREERRQMMRNRMRDMQERPQ